MQASKVLDTFFRILLGVLVVMILVFLEMVVFVVHERRDGLMVVMIVHLKLLSVIIVSFGGRCGRWWI